MISREETVNGKQHARQERWIVIPRWNGPTGFQHYKDRDPKWIKVYTRLMSDDAYLALTGNRRAILHGLWLEYAMSDRCLALDVKLIARRLALAVKMGDLEALNHAGFIEFSASKPLAVSEHSASPEVETEREEEKSSSRSSLQIPPIQEARPPAREQPPPHTDADQPELIDGGHGYLIPQPNGRDFTPIGDLAHAALFAAGQIQYPDDH